MKLGEAGGSGRSNGSCRSGKPGRPDGLGRLQMRGGRKALAFLVTLSLLCQTMGGFVCFAQDEGFGSELGGELGRELPGETDGELGRELRGETDGELGGELGRELPGETASGGSFVYGTELLPGDHVLLGAQGAASGGQETSQGALTGYDFTLLDTMTDGITGAGLLFYSNPLGLEETAQQFDEGVDGHPDEDSQADGFNRWSESDLYTALNGATRDGSTDTHGASVAVAQQFYKALSAQETEWKALLACESGESDGERVSLLSETEFETLRNVGSKDFWYTGVRTQGFWLKTPKGTDTHLVRYIYSDDITPSLDPALYYTEARNSLSVRPALRLDLGAVKFMAGSGTAEDPYRELTLRPRLESLELSGSAKVGEELSVSISPAAAACTYHWYRERNLLSHVTGSAYTLTEEDVGCIIRAEAAAEGDYVGTVEALSQKVDKGEQKPPEGNELPRMTDLKVTDRKVTLLVTQSGLEYALVTAAAVTEPLNVLEPGASTPETGASEPGTSELEQGALDLGQGQAAASSAGEPVPEDVLWTTEGAFAGLNGATDYELYVRRAEQKAYYASLPAAPLAVSTKAEGTQLTLTLSVTGWDPKKPVEVLLTPQQVQGSDAAGGDGGDGGSEAVALSSISTTASGVGRVTQTVTISGIEMDQRYRLTVRKPGHLDDIRTDVSLTENEAVEVTLPCGDVDGDGSIGWADRQLLLSARYFGKAVADYAGNKATSDGSDGEATKQAELLDLDGDGYIRLSDLYILMQRDNYGRKVHVQ